MPVFVIQEHTADRAGHHFDVRLEKDGVLKSWACRYGLPTQVGKPRLCVQVADHPMAYKNFSGEIKDGYGKGHVSVFTTGNYTLGEWNPKKITFTVSTPEIHDTFSLIKTGDDTKSLKWLAVKHK